MASQHELTSPRRSCRNHASSLALDVQLGILSSVRDQEENEKKGKKDTKEEPRKAKSAAHTQETPRAEKATKKRTSASPEKPPPIPLIKRPRKAKKNEREHENEEGETMEKEPKKGKKKKEEKREGPMTVKQLLEQRIRLSGPDFSIASLVGEKATTRKNEGDEAVDPSLGVPEKDAVVLPPDCLFANDALGHVTIPVSSDTSQFSINNTKYLPLEWLMNEQGFTVPLNQAVLYYKHDGKANVATLTDALRHAGGMSIKRNSLPKEMLLLLKQAELVIHWAFVAKLMPSRLSVSADVASSSFPRPAPLSSNDVVQRTVYELIEERKRRSSGVARGRARPSESEAERDWIWLRNTLEIQSDSSGRGHRPRQSTIQSAIAAIVNATGMEGGPSPSSPPLKISDPEHLSRFIGLMNATAQECSTEASERVSDLLSSVDGTPQLTLIQKCLLISELDAGSTEEELATKYSINKKRVADICRIRVPILREQTRMFMERKRNNLLPIRRTNYAGLNIMMWKFFKDCKERGIQLNGKQIKDHAMTIANQLGLTNFRGSEGWLDAFKRRHKMDLKQMTGEPVNYEQDKEGNIICTTEQEGGVEYSFDATREATPAINGPTDSVLAQATALAQVVEGAPLPSLPPPAAPSESLPSSSLPVEEAKECKADEQSLIANIIRSSAIHVKDKELSSALDTVRAFIVQHEPSCMGLFVDLQCRLGAVASSLAPPPVEAPPPSDSAPTLFDETLNALLNGIKKEAAEAAAGSASTGR